MPQQWSRYTAVHVAIRKLDDGGNWDAAVALATGSGNESANAAFNAFDAGLSSYLQGVSQASEKSLADQQPALVIAAILVLLSGLGRRPARSARRRGRGCGSTDEKSLGAPRCCWPLSSALLTACSVFSYTPTPLPQAPASPAPTTAASTTPVKCDNALASYAPDGDLPKPSDLPQGSTMAKIRQRGRLVAGVSADTYLLGSRNPLDGQIEGFDIDMVKAVAKAIFGDENAYQLVVITAAQRIPALQKGDVDMVARAMTINCDRWKQIAFSTEYYRAGSEDHGPQGLEGRPRSPTSAARRSARPTAPRAWTT